eukprot:1146015-Pelagomonas_calceolata.AAC.7
MGIFQPTPFCPINPQVYNSDRADTIAKGMGSIGGLAGSGWARAPVALGGPLSLDPCLHSESTPREIFHTILH